MKQSEKLLIGIEHILRIAIELVNEMTELYAIKEGYIWLKK